MLKKYILALFAGLASALNQTENDPFVCELNALLANVTYCVLPSRLILLPSFAVAE
jgi:hypothetical protein